MMSVPDGGRPELRVRLAAETASVPGARRFVTDGLVDPRVAYDRALRKEAFEPFLEEGSAA